MTKVTAVLAGKMLLYKQLHNVTVNQVARFFGIDWHTCKKALQYQGNKALIHRRVNSEVSRRRAEVKKLALKTKKRFHHECAVHPSARAISVELLRRGICASRWTVRRDLLALGFVSRVRRRVPVKDPDVQQKRYCFACALLRKPTSYLERIVFTDEHICCTNDFSHRRQWVRRGERVLTRECKRVNNVPHIMIWGAIGVGFKGPVVVFPEKKISDDNQSKAWRLDSESYIRRCLSRVASLIKQSGRILQQDGARPHVAARTKLYLMEKDVPLLQNWPPYSPDMNCIEEIWPLLNKKISEQEPTTQQELIDAIQTAWNGLTQAEIDVYSKSFESKLRECKLNFGAC